MMYLVIMSMECIINKTTNITVTVSKYFKQKPCDEYINYLRHYLSNVSIGIEKYN